MRRGAALHTRSAWLPQGRDGFPDDRNQSNQVEKQHTRSGWHPRRKTSIQASCRGCDRDLRKERFSGSTIKGPARSPSPLTTPTGNPLQHPPKHTTPRNRRDPAPITIEAGIPSSPVSQSGTHRSYKKISSQCRDQTPNHLFHQPVAQPSAACKKRFCLLFRRL